MKKLPTLLCWFSLLLFVLPFAGYGQPTTCSNQITVSYYDDGVPTSQTVNNGQSGFSAGVCPVAGAQYDFNGSSTSNAVLTWSLVTTKGTTSATDVVQNISSLSAPAGTVLSVSVSFTTASLYRLKADANSYPGSCNKVDYIYLTLTPSLTLTSPSSLAGVCAGTAVTLTSSGATGNYTWSANGTVIPNETGSTLTVSPTVTTTYTVTGATGCGTSSQQLTIPVKAVTITPSAPVICSAESTTLTASYSGVSATYQWYEQGQSAVLSSTNTVVVAPPTTTTYEVVATTSDCNVMTKTVTVTVGTPTVAITPSSRTICAGSSTVLTAVSSDPGATFSWSPATGLSATTGASVTASPTANTIYTVTATLPCGPITSDVLVELAPTATYDVTPAAPTICVGSGTTLTASSNITGATYKWYKSTDLGTAISTSAALTVAPSATTTYRILTTTTCGTNSQNVTVTVSSNPVTVTPSSSTLNYGETVTLTASGGTTYTWMATTNGVATAMPDNTASITVSPAYTTTYTVTATDLTTGCNTAQGIVGVMRPLPVELISFTAAWADSSPRLSWSTASEAKNVAFIIERSLTGESFQKVGQLAGAGTTATRTNYRFADLGLTAKAGSTVYYRLQQVDASGEASYSPIRTVVVPGGLRALSAAIFPNPYEGIATVQLQSLSAEPVTLTVVNVLGQTVLTHTVAASAGRQDIVLPQATSLPVGMYYLTIRQGNQRQVLQMSHR